MEKSNSFKFLDDDLNQQLRALLKKGQIKHDVGKDGMIYYSPADEEVVGNDFICSIRDKVFSSSTSDLSEQLDRELQGIHEPSRDSLSGGVEQRGIVLPPPSQVSAA